MFGEQTFNTIFSDTFEMILIFFKKDHYYTKSVYVHWDLIALTSKNRAQRQATFKFKEIEECLKTCYLKTQYVRELL